MSSIGKFLEEQVCKQTAVYWGAGQPDGFGGTTYPDPVEISCRWDDVTELVRDSAGEEVASKAEVLVLQDLEVGGFLYLGQLSEIDSSNYDSPGSVDGAFEIIRFDKNPSLGSSTEFCRVAYL